MFAIGNDELEALDKTGKTGKILNFTFISFGSIGKIGIDYIASVLKKSGHQVNNIYIGEFESEIPSLSKIEIDLVIGLIKNLKTDVVGFGVFSIFFNLACQLTEPIKKQTNIPVIWGGPHATLFPEICIEHADIVCIGEGEKVMSELADNLSSGKSIEDIKNLWVKSDSKIIKNELEPLNQDLDLLPFPDHGYENKWFIENGKLYSLTKEWAEQKKRYEIFSSRGCPYKCTFCSNNVFHSIFSGKPVRQRSVKNVIEELKEAKRRFPNLKTIYFFDEVFAVDEKWLKEFYGEYKSHINIPFGMCSHPNHIKKETVSLLKTAGCNQMDIGIQSGSDHIRTHIYKRHTANETIINMNKILRESGINGCYDFIMDNPFETENDYRQTFELMLKIRPFKLRLYSLAFFPKTEITEMALSQGLISQDRIQGANLETHKFHQWGGNTGVFKEAEGERTKENVFWSNLFMLASYSFVPNKILWALSKNKFLKKYPHSLSLVESLIKKYTRKISSYKNYFRVGLRYILRGQTLELLSKLLAKAGNHVQTKPIMIEIKPDISPPKV